MYQEMDELLAGLPRFVEQQFPLAQNVELRRQKEGPGLQRFRLRVGWASSRTRIMINLKLANQQSVDPVSRILRVDPLDVLTRIRQGLYANPFSPPSVDEVAMALRSPAYISLESALARHGVLSRSPVTITLVTTGQPYVFHAMDLVFEYHHIKRQIFTGFERQGACLLAEPEKALADLVYLRHRRRRQLDTERLRSLLDDMDLDLLNRDRLAHYAQGMKLEFGVFDL